MVEISCPYESFELSCLNEEYYEEINQAEADNSNNSGRVLHNNDMKERITSSLVTELEV